MIITKFDISCIWGGTLVGVLLKNDTTFGQTTTKLIGIHGWLDNLNSLLPLAEKLIDRHPNYEIYLYDRAGHGFSSHLPKGSDYSNANNLQDLRTIIQTLGWNQGKFSIIGHSYGAMLGMTYAASYPAEVVCVVSIDAIPRAEAPSENFWEVYGARIDASLKFHNRTSRTFNVELTLENAFELTKSSRPGITDEAAKLLTERSIRRDINNKLHFTRDESLKILSLFPVSAEMIRDLINCISAPILFIGALNPQWPRAEKTIDLLKEHNPNFEMALIDGPHHLHMTHVNEVFSRIDQYFDKYLQSPSTTMTEDSKL